MTVRLKPAAEHGGIPEERARTLKAAVNKSTRLKGLVRLEQSKEADFEVDLAESGDLRIFGPQRRFRIGVKSSRYEGEDLAWNLWLHAVQRHLQQLQGETGKDLIDEASLELEIVPTAEQPICVRGQPKKVGKNERVAPLCLIYNLQVTNKATVPMRVGGLILSSDGSIFGFPSDGVYPLLAPGKSLVLKNDPFQAGLPLNMNDHMLIFGTPPEEAIYWHLFYHRATRVTASRGPSYEGLTNFIAGKRSNASLVKGENGAWTMSRLSMKTFANLLPDGPSAKRFIANFDSRPYLAADTNSILYRLLTAVNAPATAADGQAPLHVLQRAGLAVNQKLSLTAADLTTHSNPLPFWGDHRFGDILIYADPSGNPAWSLLVIDGPRGFGWASLDKKTGYLAIPDKVGPGAAQLHPLARWRHKQLQALPLDLGWNALIDACQCQ